MATNITAKFRKAFKDSDKELRGQEATLLREVHVTHVLGVINKYQKMVPSIGATLATSEESPIAVEDILEGQLVGSQTVVDEIQSLPPNVKEYLTSPSKQKQRMRCRPLLPCIASLPGNNAYVPIKSNLHVADEKALKHLPYLGDNLDKNDEKRLFADYELGPREQRLSQGDPNVMQRKQRQVDLTLQKLALDGSVSDKEMDVMCVALAASSKTNVDFIASRLELALGTSTDEKPKLEVHEEEMEQDDSAEAYAKRMNTYRELYCAVCYKYDCNTHGNDNKPSLLRQFNAAKGKNWSRQNLAQLSSTSGSIHFEPIAHLSHVQKDMCLRLFAIFDADILKVSNCLRAPAHLVEAFGGIL